MPKHIGIVACSAEGVALCYRTLCSEAPVKMGTHTHPEVSMHTYPLSNYMTHIRSGNWTQVAGLMLSSVQKLATIGAEFAVCPDNTIHQTFDLVTEKSPIPWLHIAETVAQEAKIRGFQQLALIGTKYLMTSFVYPNILEKSNISCQIPEGNEQEKINNIIFEELVNGIFLEDSRFYFNQTIQEFKDKGCEAIILGCTEIPILVDPEDCPLPILDSTRLLARAALEEALRY